MALCNRLGVDRDYEGQGIGRRLMKTAHNKAGGEKDIDVYLMVLEKGDTMFYSCELAERV